MQFSTSQVIHAPQDAVFAEVTDFDSFERQIARAGGSVDRTGPPGPEAAWTGAFDFRGTRRTASAQVTAWTPPAGFGLTTQSGGLTARAEVRCVPMEDGRTRLDVVVDLSAQTLTARVLLNSLKLMRQQIDRRLARRVRDFADGVAHRAGRQG